MPSRLPPLRPQCVRPSPCSLCKMCSLPGRCSNPPPPEGSTQDTTRTGIIKDFLRKMGPEGDVSNTTALNEGKADFQRFFADSGRRRAR